MSANHRSRRFAVSISLAASVLALGVTALLAGTHPAEAGAALARVQDAVTCTTTGTAPCASWTNTSSGLAILGKSNTGAAVRGESTKNSGVLGSSTVGYGVLGQAYGNAAGVAGTSPNNYGVYGFTTGSSGGIGVYGTSASGYGLYGTTKSGSGYGVVGVMSGAGTALYGATSSGYGVQAISSSGYGLYSQAYGTGSSIYASANTGYGIISRSAGSTAIYARNTSGNAGDYQGSYIGVVSRASATGYPFVATDTSGNNLFYVDGKGNVSYKGGLFSIAPSSNGSIVKSFSTKTTAPTVEDTGTAQLVGGLANVRLDPTFASSIDANGAYRVFVTPGGDTRGLYVTGKTSQGFVVRESQGGRSTVSFDYRIVATSLGQRGQRMSMVRGLSEIAPHAEVPTVPDAPAARVIEGPPGPPR